MIWHFDWNKGLNIYGKIIEMKNLLRHLEAAEENQMAGVPHEKKVSEWMLTSASHFFKLYFFVYRLINVLYQM